LTPQEKIKYINTFYNKQYGEEYPLNKEISLDDNDFSIMGNYRSIKNKDDKGEYIDYYDYWDLDPLELEKKFGKNVSDFAQAGKPMNIYDRIYVKDYGTDGNHWYKPVFYNDDELKNLDINKAKQEELVAELENRGYKIKDKNSKEEVEKTLKEFQNKNSQKKKLGGWLNNYK
jgi:hypothetical protein